MDWNVRMNETHHINWPKKYNLLGVPVSSTTYEEAENLITDAVQQGIPALVDHMPVHGLTLASSKKHFRVLIDTFNIVAPDGQPVRWALNLLYNTKLSDRVYGPEFMFRLCHRAAKNGVSIYLYGSHPHVVDKLQLNLIQQIPALQIVGYESPPFRPLSQEEDERVVERINRSGAGIVFIGLGCPKQEIFAYEHRERVKAVQICVGAAFDFHAGEKKMAPLWMQRNGLEWFFRLITEPRRLWRRYLFTNTIFLIRIFPQIISTYYMKSKKPTHE